MDALTPSEVKKIILECCQHQKFRLPDILYGIAVVESSLNPIAVRYEPNYRWLYFVDTSRPPNCSRETEEMLQKTSFGLYQMMGAVLRENGWTGWLTGILLDPVLQTVFAIKHFKRLHRRYPAVMDIISAWNAGKPTPKNKAYVDKVLQASTKFMAIPLEIEENNV